MGNSTAGKNRLTGFFWLVIAVCLLPFLLLPFLNGMAADDFHFYNLYREHGFWGAQEFIYRTWAGRYTTTFLSGSVVSLDLLRHYYWMPCMGLFVCTWGAIFFLLRSLCSVLAAGLAGRQIAQISFVLFVLFLYVQADIATGFYWFSSAIVYQTSFILFLVFAGCLIKRLFIAGPAPGRDALLLLLAALIIGCNEMAAVFLLLFLAVLVGILLVDRGKAPGYLWLCLGVALALCIVIASTSGVIRVRHRLMNGSTSYLGVLPVVVFQFIIALFAVFKEPLFWFAGIAAFLFGVRLSQEAAFAAFREKKVLVPGLALLLLPAVFGLLTVMIGSRGSLPPRALNNLTGWLAGGSLALAFLAGIRNGAAMPALGTIRLSPVLLTGLLTVLLLASVNYRDAWKTVVSGYFYHAVQVDRDRRLTEAGRQHEGTVTLPDYQEAEEDRIHEAFPHGVFETVHSLLLERPPLIYYYDGAATRDPAYRLYYGLDSIIVR